MFQEFWKCLCFCLLLNFLKTCLGFLWNHLHRKSKRKLASKYVEFLKNFWCTNIVTENRKWKYLITIFRLERDAQAQDRQGGALMPYRYVWMDGWIRILVWGSNNPLQGSDAIQQVDKVLSCKQWTWFWQPQLRMQWQRQWNEMKRIYLYIYRQNYS